MRLSASGVHRRRILGPLSLLLLMFLVVTAAAACGGGESSANPTPTRAPATSPAGGDDYRTTAQNAATKLGKQADALVKDMQAGQTSQSDPKWPGVFTSDADLIVAAANELKSLTPPEGALTDVQGQFVKAADALIHAAELMKTTVQTADQTTGTQAYFALTQGKGLLNDALAALK